MKERKVTYVTSDFMQAVTFQIHVMVLVEEVYGKHADEQAGKVDGMWTQRMKESR